MQKLNLQEAAHLMGVRCENDALFSGVSVDSRLHKPENLFFALQGAKTDGHHFLQDVAAKGAAGAVVKRNYSGPSYGLELIYVEDPLNALQSLTNKVLQKYKIRIVAVTGSLGKTTTKEFITAVLKEKYRVAFSPGNSNSQIGVPLAILNHTNGTEDILVLEMGMTHPGNIKKLIEIAPPECAILTTVALVHACNFNSIEEIALAKAEILTHPKTQLAVINRDISNYDEIVKIGSCQKISFSYSHPLANYAAQTNASNHLSIKNQEKVIELGKFPFPGKHLQSNFLAVVACARYFGLSWENIASGMQKLVLPDLRGQMIEKEGILFVNDCYNAAEMSVKAALENIPQPKAGRYKIAVLSDMLELGKFSEKAHREVGQHALNFVDYLFCYGTECRYIFDCWSKAGRPVQWFTTRQELLVALKRELKAGDVALIKGSRGTQMYKLLDEWETMHK